MSECGDEVVNYVLHDAAERGDAAAIIAALEAEEDAEYNPSASPIAASFLSIDTVDRLGCTPLHVALLNKSEDAARACIAQGAEMLMRLAGMPYLHVALSMGGVPENIPFVDAIVPVLVEAGAAWNASDRFGRSAVHVAAQHGLLKHVKAGIEADADLLLWLDSNNQTVLHVAAMYNHADIVEFIGQTAQARGADVFGTLASATDTDGNTALHVAALRNSKEAAAAFRQFAMPKPSSPEEDIALVKNRAGDTAQDILARHFPDDAADAPKTLLVRHDDCEDHHTAASHARSAPEPPPENELRLHVLTNPVVGSLRAAYLQRHLAWDNEPPLATMADVLRVHEYAYVHRIIEACGEARPDGVVPDDNIADGSASAASAAAAATPHTKVHDIKLIDQDTAVSASTFRAALRAAGSMLHAVEAVCAGRARHAFCAVRPPGHHAGPHGLVTCPNDPDGSHGFCIFNNVAIAAAYARSNPRLGVKRVAIVDFDVHHGNGTEAVVRNVVPTKNEREVVLPFGVAKFSSVSYKPWLDATDGDAIFFASLHGFGKRDPNTDTMPHAPWFYPASGHTCGVAAPAVAATATGPASATSADGTIHGVDSPATTSRAHQLFEAGLSAPTVINVGLPRSKDSAARWRIAMMASVLPRLAAFDPDLILISAGFDAHRADGLAHGYLALTEADYAWATQQLVKIANKCCPGRLVSVLEGGYRIAGVGASPFAQSVAAHVETLATGSHEVWDSDREKRALDAAMAAATAPAAAAVIPADDVPALAAAAGAAGAGAGASAAAGAAGAGAAAAPPSRRSKRRRTGPAVDYAALSKKLDEEEAAAAKAAAAAASQDGDTAAGAVAVSAAAAAAPAASTADDATPAAASSASASAAPQEEAEKDVGSAALLAVDSDDDDDDEDFNSGDDDGDDDDAMFEGSDANIDDLSDGDQTGDEEAM